MGVVNRHSDTPPRGRTKHIPDSWPSFLPDREAVSAPTDMLHKRKSGTKTNPIEQELKHGHNAAYGHLESKDM